MFEDFSYVLSVNALLKLRSPKADLHDTSTSLEFVIGLIKHLHTWESKYFVHTNKLNDYSFNHTGFHL